MPGWFSYGEGSSSSSSSNTRDGIVECHFCGSRFALLQHGKGKARQERERARRVLDVIEGTPSSFKCRACESWNLRDMTGRFLDEAPIYSDPQLNYGSSRLHAVRSSLASSSAVRSLVDDESLRRDSRSRSRSRSGRDIDDGVFCSECVANQNLQLQLLANYIPDGISRREEDLLTGRLDAYRAGLHDRYPLVCDGCARRVDEVIRDRNLKAKARTVGGWLRRTVRQEDVDGAPGSATSSQLAASSSTWSLALWRIRGLLWHLLNILAVLSFAAMDPSAAPFITRLVNQSTSPAISIYRPYEVVAFSIATLCIAFWDPTYRQRLRQRGGQCTVHGQSMWLTLQLLLHGGRSLSLLAMAERQPLPVQVSRTLLALHLATLSLHPWIIYTTGPRRVQLVNRSQPSTPTRTQTPAQSTPVDDTRNIRLPPEQRARSLRNGRTPSLTRTAPLPANLTFGRTAFGQPPQSIQTFDPKSYRDVGVASTNGITNVDDEEEPEAMDWNGMEEDHLAAYDVEMSDSGEVEFGFTPHVQLRPAVFNPDGERWNDANLGSIRKLEKLFEEGVSLSDVAEKLDHATKDKASPRFHITASQSVAVPLLLASACTAGVCGAFGYILKRYKE